MAQRLVPVDRSPLIGGNRSSSFPVTPLLSEPLLLQTLWPGGSPLLPTTPPLLIPFLASLCLRVSDGETGLSASLSPPQRAPTLGWNLHSKLETSCRDLRPD